MGQKNIFGGIFGRNFGRTATNEISKVGEMEGKNLKILDFF